MGLMNDRHFTDTLPEGLPDAAALIEGMRKRLAEKADPAAVLADALAEHPALGMLAPVPVLAGWLGVKESSVYMARSRKRADGSPVWADEDDTILGRKMWTFGGVALHRATAPGRGWNLRSEIREGAK
jgi:hypothetical protein